MQQSSLLALGMGLLAAMVTVPESGVASNQLIQFEFKLSSTTGELVECSSKTINSYAVICFLGTECPLARLYAPRLSQLAVEFEKQGVRFIGVNSNQQDSMDELKIFQRELEVSFPLVKDYDNKIADKFSATRTPEVFVIDARMGLKYRGAIDNQYLPGVARKAATRHYLKDAIEDLISGREIEASETKPEGCLIGRARNPVAQPTVTFASQVSRLFQKHCIECHRNGEIGPFALQDYDEAKGWAEMIVEVVDNGRMPPWHATDKYSSFVNERFLSESEKQLLRDWLAQGTPFGDAERLPAPKEFTTGWRLPREPEVVVEMGKKAFTVPASGTVEYQYFVVDPKFKKDKWVTAAEVIPGNRGVVHHSIVFVRPPDGKPFRGIGWLAAYVPGQGSPFYKPSHARLVPAGSKLVFQQHYTPNGKSESDITRIGFLLGRDEDISHEVFTLASLDQEFEIPASNSNHSVRSQLPWFPENGRLIGFAPHMHYRGKSFKLFSQSDNEKKQLIDVPAYDFNWQHNYQLKTPLTLSDVDRLECHFTFDNSEANPFNPDSSRIVTWGDQTWEEMAIAFFEVAQPRYLPITVADEETVQQSDRQPDINARNVVDEYFEKFDKNKDGVLVRSETPHAVQHFRFRRYDADSNGSISREELLMVARSRGN